jgi:Sugar (and other) transporter
MIIFADSLGRRQFLIGGSSVMVIGLVVLCVGLGYDSIVASLVGIYLAVAAFEVSLGTMLYVMLSGS